jgi:hypothetical protein
MPAHSHLPSHPIPSFRLTRLGLVALLVTTAFVVLAPASAAQAAAPSDGADLCARVGDRAGFPRNDTLVLAVAIGLAESGCIRTARGVNGPTQGCPNGSVDRGLWQINSCWHPEVSDRCSYRAQCNAHAAYAISSGGTDFTPWVTYNAGLHLRYMDEARAAVDRLGT